MGHRPFSRIITCAIVLIAQSVATGLSQGVRAQQLAIRHYDVSDGLAHSHVSAMHQDGKGYLWLATWEGLSRFDGYRFTNYGQRDGLGDPIINDITEDRNGAIWVATNGGGIARLIDDNQASAVMQSGARQKFVSYRVGDSPVSNRVNALLFDSRNDPWCATDGGLYRGAYGKNGDFAFAMIIPKQTEIKMAAYADHSGRLWFGIQNELIEVVGDQIFRYGQEDEVGRSEVESIIEDRQGRLLVANQHQVFEFIMPADDKRRGRWQGLPLSVGPHQDISAMLCDLAGALWLGTSDGLIKYYGGKQTLFTVSQGLSDNHIQSLAEDRDGNLWIGSFGGGVCKLSSELIVTFKRTEGLPTEDVQKVVEDFTGQIYASIHGGGIVKIVGDRAVTIAGSQVAPFIDVNDRIFQDRNGDWWIGTDAGLFRFPGPAMQLQRGHKFSTVDGIAVGSISSGLYQDSRGTIWI